MQIIGCTSSSPANGSGSNLSSNPTTGDIYNGPYSGADEDGVANDCYKWNANGQASTSLMNTPYTTFASRTYGSFEFLGQASDPLESSLFGYVAIKWDVSVAIDTSNPSAPQANINYAHTCYPDHIVKVNGLTAYEYVPPIDTTWYLTRCLAQLPGFTLVQGSKLNVTVPVK